MAHADEHLLLDFYGDWIATLRASLTSCGYVPPAEDQKVEIAYFNMLKRLVPAVPRTIHVAPTLVPPAEVLAGYELVRRKVEAGEDLRPHLSRSLTNVNFNDLLLNDWGIHHLHLGTTLDKDGFMARSGPVLFARFRSKVAYFIAIADHGPDKSPWSDFALLELFAETWPEQMRRYELRGIAPSRSPQPNPSNAELGQLRAKGVQALLTIAGKVYGPMGGGLSTARVAIDVVERADRCTEIVRGFERMVVAESEGIFRMAEKHGVTLTRPVRFRMVARQDGSALATTEDWAFGFPLGQILARPDRVAAVDE